MRRLLRLTGRAFRLLDLGLQRGRRRTARHTALQAREITAALADVVLVTAAGAGAGVALRVSKAAMRFSSACMRVWISPICVSIPLVSVAGTGRAGMKMGQK